MKSNDTKNKEIEILDWLDGYEAWNQALNILTEYNSPQKEGKVHFYFNFEERKWIPAISKHDFWKPQKNISGEIIECECYIFEFFEKERHRTDDPEFDIIVNDLVEGTKDYIKRYFR